MTLLAVNLSSPAAAINTHQAFNEMLQTCCCQCSVPLANYACSKALSFSCQEMEAVIELEPATAGHLGSPEWRA